MFAVSFPPRSEEKDLIRLDTPELVVHDVKPMPHARPSPKGKIIKQGAREPCETSGELALTRRRWSTKIASLPSSLAAVTRYHSHRPQSASLRSSGPAPKQPFLPNEMSSFTTDPSIFEVSGWGQAPCYVT